MVFTPSPMLLKLLYTRGSLHNLPQDAGVAFSIQLTDAYGTLHAANLSMADFLFL